jgi:hypothetical protein
VATVKYDVSNVEDIPERTPAPVGIYRGKIVKAELKESKAGNPMIECEWELTHDAQGKKLKEDYGHLWDYPILGHDHPFVQNRLKDFINALGLKSKGAIDTDKLVGKSAQLKLKSDTDQDGDYRPRIGKIMPLSNDEDPGEEEEPEEAEEEAEDDEEEEELDLDSLSRTELKALIKEEELEIKVLRKHSDDDLRQLIAEAMAEEDEEEAEDEEEEEEDTEAEESESAEDEDDGYDDMSVKDLKSELSERELPTNGPKAKLIERLRKDDADEPF